MKQATADPLQIDTHIMNYSGGQKERSIFSLCSLYNVVSYEGFWGQLFQALRMCKLWQSYFLCYKNVSVNVIDLYK